VTLRFGVLISGRGSNLQAIIEACAQPGYPAEIALVISNEPNAQGLVRAQNAGLTIGIIDHRSFVDRAAFETALTFALEEAGVELVCLAGFMRMLTHTFVDHWNDRLINVHPSLLPAFKGLDVHERVIAAGARFSGCTVHFVRVDMDAGPIIVQSAVPVLSHDRPEDLAARVLAFEHESLPMAIKWIAENRVQVIDGVVEISGAIGPEGGLINPSGAR
jgi:phosphoribosylglycinamide formyltransferase-1